jgi:hypothetical protein
VRLGIERPISPAIALTSKLASRMRFPPQRLTGRRDTPGSHGRRQAAEGQRHRCGVCGRRHHALAQSPMSLALPDHSTASAPHLGIVQGDYFQVVWVPSVGREHAGVALVDSLYGLV